VGCFLVIVTTVVGCFLVIVTTVVAGIFLVGVEGTDC
jgi:hypothetical protein